MPIKLLICGAPNKKECEDYHLCIFEVETEAVNFYFNLEEMAEDIISAGVKASEITTDLSKVDDELVLAYRLQSVEREHLFEILVSVLEEKTAKKKNFGGAPVACPSPQLDEAVKA